MGSNTLLKVCESPGGQAKDDADVTAMYMLINPAVTHCLYFAAQILCQLVLHNGCSKDHLSLRHCHIFHYDGYYILILHSANVIRRG